jgi:hypothetical protein
LQLKKIVIVKTESSKFFLDFINMLGIKAFSHLQCAYNRARLSLLQVQLLKSTKDQ